MMMENKKAKSDESRVKRLIYRRDVFLESRRETSAGGFSLDDAAITRELMSMSNDLNSPFYPATTYSFARPVSASNPDFSAWNTTGRGTSVFGGDMSLLRHNRGSRCADRGLPHDFRADGAKPFAGWRGLHDTRPFFRPATPCQASRGRHGHCKAFAIISIPLLSKPNTLSRLSKPNIWPPLYLELPPNLPSKKQCVLFRIRTPYVLVTPFVHRPKSFTRHTWD